MSKVFVFDRAHICSAARCQHLLYLCRNTVSYYHSRCPRSLALAAPLSQHLQLQHSSQNSLTSHIHRREYHNKTAKTGLEGRDVVQKDVSSVFLQADWLWNKMTAIKLNQAMFSLSLFPLNIFLGPMLVWYHFFRHHCISYLISVLTNNNWDRARSSLLFPLLKIFELSFKIKCDSLLF